MILLVAQSANNNWPWIGNLISGVSVVVGALIAYRSTHRTLRAQREIAEYQVTNSKEVNQSQMNEKLILENRVSWDNETRELILKLIGQFFSLNHTIEKSGIIQKRLDLSRDSSIPVKQREKMMRLTENERKDLVAGMESMSAIVETVALVRLHLFEDTPNERRVWDKIIDIEQHFSKSEKVPSNELNELTEIARIYFQGNWERSMMMNNSGNTVAHV
ncbi:hypothetical protein [Lactiplantibacillus plantarum]|uniref:hypothetical protein n=1 Tax=Lactiplantibacillus plantarum TaxID=1590 RepID=UPI003CF5699F